MYPETYLRRPRPRGVLVEPYDPEGEETAALLARAGLSDPPIRPLPAGDVAPLSRPRRVGPPPPADPRMALPEYVGTPPPSPPISALSLPTTAPDPAAVGGADLRGLGPAPLMRNSAGETLTKPQMVGTGDRLSDLSAYKSQLEDYRNPKDTEGRGMSALKSAGLMALQGFFTGGLPGAIRGAGYGAIRGALAPNFNERVERDRELARVGQQFGNELAMRQTAMEMQGAALKRMQEAAGLQKTQAETEDILDRPERERLKLRADWEKEGRVRQEVERHNREMEKHQTNSLADQRARAEETARHNREMERIGELQAEATQGRFEAEFGRKTADDEYDDEVRRTERDHQNRLEGWKAAESKVKEYNDARKDYAATVARIKAIEKIPEGKREPDTQVEYAELVERSNQLADGLRALEPQVGGEHAQRLPDGYFSMKAKPEMPGPPQRRSVDPPRRAGSASQGGGRFTEAEVRARARAQGKDENAAVEAARAKGFIR